MYQQNPYPQNTQAPAPTQPQFQPQNWDDLIVEEATNSRAYEVLEDGEYPFKVRQFDRLVHGNPGKLYGANKIALQLELDGGRAIAYDDIFWIQSWQWKQAQFFGAIGQKKPGQPLRPNWATVTGASGICRVAKEQYTKRNGETAYKNVIKAYIVPEAGTPQAQAPAPTPGTLPFDL